MHKKTVVLILLLFAYLLVCPQAALASARNGLLLWYHSVLPVLFPFLFLGNLIMKTVNEENMPKFLTLPLTHIFGCSPSGAFVILAGFLCGLPMGAKLTGNLYRENKITRKEALYLAGFTNNLSPGFICSYLAADQMQMPERTWSFLIQILGAALLYGFLSSAIQKRGGISTALPKCEAFPSMDSAAQDGSACQWHAPRTDRSEAKTRWTSALRRPKRKRRPCPRAKRGSISTEPSKCEAFLSMDGSSCPRRVASSSFGWDIRRAKRGGISTEPSKCGAFLSTDGSSCRRAKRGGISTADLFTIIDSCIYDATENVLRLGAYILLFSILSGALIRLMPVANPAVLLAISGIEVTAGIRLLAKSTLPAWGKYLSVSALAASGGLCSLAQSIGIGGMDQEMISCYIKSRAKITLLAILLSLSILCLQSF